MTTLQTLSSRSTHSAEFSAQRAQSGDPRADGAQGFAGVLDAFNAEPSEPLAEEAPDQSSPESTESADADPDAKTQDTTSDESSDQPIEVDESSTKTDTGKEPVQEPVDADPVKHTEPVDTRPIHFQAQAHSIHSASDLGVLLTNAASIDLAALATKQLEGNPGKPVAGGSDSDPTLIGHKPQHSKPVSQSHITQSSNQPKPQGAGADLTLPGSTASSLNGRDGSPPATTNIALSKPDQQIQSSEITAPTTHHQHQHTQVQAAQGAQAATPDTTNSRLNGARSIAEIAGIASKAVPTASNSPGSQTGSGHNAMDLGSQPRAASKGPAALADDRVMQRQQVLSQVQRGLASIMNTKGGSMKLRLTPEHLGEVNIQLTTKDGTISVQIDAKNDATRSMLESGLEDLRHAMESRGATVHELRVQTPEPSAFERLFGQTTHSDDNNRSGSDQNQNESNQHTRDEHADRESDHQSTPHEPRGIWTDIGLDAIA